MTDAGAAESEITLALQKRMLTRALAARDFGTLHLRFDIAVLDRYRELGAKLIRTRTVGRVSLHQWSVDLGIVTDESGATEVHLPARDLLERVPKPEHAHWVAHLVAQPAASRFLQMLIVPGACIDDGDTEEWK